MNLELTETQSKVLHEVIETYLSDLREEISKTEKHEWRVALREQKAVLAEIQRKLH